MINCCHEYCKVLFCLADPHGTTAPVNWLDWLTWKLQLTTDLLVSVAFTLSAAVFIVTRVFVEFVETVTVCGEVCQKQMHNLIIY